MKSGKKIFRKYLNDKGLRFTPERDAILEEVFSTHEHFDVEELYRRLYKNGISVSRATIYRTLPLLIDCGLISEAMRCKDRIYYEHTYGHLHHAHLVCIKCGKIIEFNDKRIEEIKEEMVKRYGFEPLEHKFGIKGYCEDCQ